MKKRVLVVGGGFGGIKAALELKNNKHFDVTLMSPHARFEYHGAMYRSATGRSPLEVVIPLSTIFDDALNVRVELDSMVELRAHTKEVEAESGRVYPYDVLILALGNVVNYFGISGMARYAHSMYSISDVIRLRHALVGTFRNSHTEKPVSVTVVGAGATGVELAADVTNFSRIVAGKHGLNTLNVDVHLVEAADRVLPLLNHEASDIAKQRLTELGVQMYLETMVKKCKKSQLDTNKGPIESDVIIWTAGAMANPFFTAYKDIFTLDQRKRVVVSEYLQANDPTIYVIGDCAATEYSGMAQTAIHNALFVAENLKLMAEGKKPHTYTPKLPNYVIPIGGQWALLQTKKKVISGEKGWQERRNADRWVLENFLPYELADQRMQYGDRIAQF